MIVASNKSPYEIERNKPLPNRVHGVIEANLGSLLQLNYRNRYQIALEVSLATSPDSTPDLCIFPKKKLSLKNIEAKETEAPITTIEIQSPSQSIEELQDKA
ncbi:MAG: Uma2 family endonuclease [Bacteroidota bacterium]